MKDKIGTIGHVDHGKTTLSAAIAIGMAAANQEVMIETKTIHEELEHVRALKITASPIIELTEWDFKDGKQGRRERRAKERKANRKR